MEKRISSLRKFLSSDKKTEEPDKLPGVGCLSLISSPWILFVCFSQCISVMMPSQLSSSLMSQSPSSFSKERQGI